MPPTLTGVKRPTLSLREQAAAAGAEYDASPSIGARRDLKPLSNRYDRQPASSSRSGSASRSASGAARGVGNLAGLGLEGRVGTSSRPRSQGPADLDAHRPGSLFGLAANLGIGPGSLAAQGVAGFESAASIAPAEDVETGDIDARLQALQSFLKQTKNLSQ